MNTEELEEKIWRYATEWISKSKLHVRVGGDKKACFDRIDLMIPMQLKVKKYKNRIMVCRVDTSRRAEFDNGLLFQKNMLGLMRDELKKYPKPMFVLWHEIIHYIPPLTKANFKEFQKEYNYGYGKKLPKGFKVDEVIKVWKTTRPNVKKTLENMKFYYTGLIIFISRCLLQKSLGILSTKEANIRIKKCEKVLEQHFKILLKQNKKDSEAIRQFHEYGYGLMGSIYDVGKFRI